MNRDRMAVRARWIALGSAVWAMGWSTGALPAATCRLESPAHRVAVLELYTSEGCNSCPPADRWLSGLPRRGVTADRAVLLAFHVDYWNQLGWPDRFSQPAFSARQREVAARASSGVVYTPQAVVDGRALRQTYVFGDLDSRLSAINREKARASISAGIATRARMVQIDGEVRLADGTANRDAEAWLAVFEQGLSSTVTRGENAGKLLYHDFVVRRLAGPFRIAADGRGRIQQDIALHPDWSFPRLGLAIFVQRRDDGSTLQAVSSYPLCGS
jgi:hypothetical protein